MLSKGLLFIVSAPAGTGKTTLVQKLTKEFPDVEQSVSFTTREKRVDEEDGKHYHFVSLKEFNEMKKKGDFLEFAKVYSDFYGTSKSQIEKKQKKGIHQFLVIDTQGAKKLKKIVDAVHIFIKPPSMRALEKRLRGRKTESNHTVVERLAWAKKEIQQSKQYDYMIINDDLEVAYDALRSILIAEEHRLKQGR